MRLRLAVPLVLCTFAPAQSGADGDAVDPYTKGEREAIEKAGYVQVGPGEWGKKVDEHLPAAGIRWVETAHFELGVGLDDCAMPRVSQQRRAVTAEIQEIAPRLPTLKKPKGRTVDRWLLVHVYAHRLEKLYAGLQGMLGVTDADFPGKGASVAAGKPYMGRGKYLGMEGKFRVLILQKRGDMTRYRTHVLGPDSGDPSQPFHHHVVDVDCMMYCTSLEVEDEAEDPHHALHMQLLFHVCQAMLNGFRHYDFHLPAWIPEGIGNAFVRDADPRHFEYSAIDGIGTRTAGSVKWVANTRRLVKNGYFPKAEVLCVRQLASEMTLNDHMCAWARVDFLRKLDGGVKFAKFMTRMKAPKAHVDGKAPEYATILKAQVDALQSELGMDFAGFDAAFAEWVVKNYPDK